MDFMKVFFGILALIGVAVGLYIFYNIVQQAVKTGILEANKVIEKQNAEKKA